MAMDERRRRGRGLREHRGFSLALAAALALGAGACSKAAAPDLGAGGVPRSSGQQTVPPGQPGGGIVTSPPSTSGTGSNGTGSGSNGSGSKFTTDDMKTYGYSFSDEAAITADLTLVTATLQQFGADAASHDVSAAEADAATLLDEAKGLESDAGSATGRISPLKPSDADLRKIRSDALAAFGITEDYATSVVDLANAALSLNLQELAAAAQQALALQGTSTQLTTSYQNLTTALGTFAEANPVAAGTAVAQYGG